MYGFATYAKILDLKSVNGEKS